MSIAYQSNDASGATSWIDHFICDDAFAVMAGPVAPLYCEANLSDNVPIGVTLNLPPNALNPDFVTLGSAVRNAEVNQHTDMAVCLRAAHHTL